MDIIGCWLSLKNKISSKEFNERMGDVYVVVVDGVKQGCFKWFGYPELVSACRNLFLASARGRGRGKKT